MNIETLVHDSVEDFVRDMPPRPGMADTALRGARRRRATRIGLGSGLAVATVATAIWATGLVDLEDQAPEAGGDAGEQIELDKLPTGPSPEVAWYSAADGKLHFGDSVANLDAEFARDGSDLERVDGGYLVTANKYTANKARAYELILVSDGGQQTLLDRGSIGNVAVSKDGQRAAWAVGDWSVKPAQNDPNTTLVVANATSGDVLHELPENLGADTRAVGFIDSQTVLIDAGSRGDKPRDLYRWNLDTNQIELWKEDAAVADLAPSGDIVAAVTQHGGGVATDVLDTQSGDVLWTVPKTIWGVSAFSPDGRYVALADGLINGEEPPANGGVEGTDEQVIVEPVIVIADARTGAEMQRFAVHEDSTQLEWESDDTIVFDGVAGGQGEPYKGALVRSTVAGDCERTTETVRGPDDAPMEPYSLGGNWR